MATLSDDALVDLVKLGEAAAFARLIERHHRFCLSRAYSILRNHDDADDEVQTAWVQAWTHLASYQGQARFSGWLSRIVSNQCLMRLRKARRMPVISVEQVIEAGGSFRLEVIDQRALPEDLVGDDEVSGVLMKEIYGLPPLLRRVLVMRDLHEMTAPAIAAHLGLSLPAVKSRLMRGRHELRQRLRKDQGEKGGGSWLQRSGRGRAAYLRVDNS